MRLILLKVHEEYETLFMSYVKERGYYTIEVARTGDYLEYGYCLYLLYFDAEKIDTLVSELQLESSKHQNEAYSNIEMFVLSIN